MRFDTVYWLTSPQKVVTHDESSHSLNLLMIIMHVYIVNTTATICSRKLGVSKLPTAKPVFPAREGIFTVMKK